MTQPTGNTPDMPSVASPLSSSLAASLSLLQVEKTLEAGDWRQVGGLAGKRDLLAGQQESDGICKVLKYYFWLLTRL